MEPLAFAYHRSLGPMLWFMVLLAGMELFVIHLLISLLWSWEVATILSVLTLLTIAWLVRLIRSFRRLPVLVGADGIVLRSGHLSELRVAPSVVKGVRTSWPGEALKDRSVLNLAMLSHPNLLVDLAEPIERRGRRRQIAAVALRLDDPDGFRRAMAGLGIDA